MHHIDSKPPWKSINLGQSPGGLEKGPEIESEGGNPPLVRPRVELHSLVGEGDGAGGQVKDGSGPDSPTSPLGALASLLTSLSLSAPLWKLHTPLSC